MITTSLPNGWSTRTTTVPAGSVSATGSQAPVTVRSRWFWKARSHRGRLAPALVRVGRLDQPPDLPRVRVRVRQVLLEEAQRHRDAVLEGGVRVRLAQDADGVAQAPVILAEARAVIEAVPAA